MTVTPKVRLNRRVLLSLAGQAAALSATLALAACGATTTAIPSVATRATTVATSPTVAKAAASTPTTTRDTASTAPSAAITTSAAATAPPSAALTLTITSWLKDKPNIDAYNALFSAYEKLHPDVRLQQQTYPAFADYFPKVTALLASNTSPDLIESNWGYSQTLGTKNAIKPLDPLITQDKIALDEYVQSAIELGRWPQKSGKYYAWYSMFSTSPLYYNLDLFQAAGQPLPDDTWTWDHLVDVAQKLTKPGQTAADSVYGFNLTQYAETLLYSYGWTYTSPDFTQCALESAPNLAAMQLWHDFVYKYKVSPPPGSTFGQGAPFGVFSTKLLAMETQGSYQIGRYQTVKGLNWDIAVPPLGPAGRRAVVKGSPGHSLPTQSPHSDAAWGFLSWWIQNQTPDQVVNPGNLPSRLAALQNWAAQQKQASAVPAHIEVVYDTATKYGQPITVLPNDTDAEAALGKEQDAILKNQEDVKTGMANACTTMLAAIKQGQA